MAAPARSPRSPRTGYVLPLRAVGRTDRARAGTKAANLGELANANFPVPDGVVLTADAFGRLLDQRPRRRKLRREHCGHATALRRRRRDD